MKRLIFIIISLLCWSTTYSQRRITELETNSDGDMMVNSDSIDENKDKKKVPVDVKAWRIDDIYGNRTAVDVDTLHHLYQNNDLPEGPTGTYNTLGNLGSPRQNRIFMSREENNDFIFTNPFDMFFIPTDKMHFFDTKSPLTNISYNFCGQRTSGDDHFKALFTRNANKRLNFGGIYDYIYGVGYYDNQSTSFMNFTVFSTYLGERYDYHFYYKHNHMKMAENGGISDDTYITNPEDIAYSFTSSDIPTNLDNTWTKQDHDLIFFNHHYNIGFKKEEGDSANMKTVFVPVTRFFHTFSFEKYKRRYIAYYPSDTYYTNLYINEGDTINDKITEMNMRNTVGISLCEGFNKYAAAGLNAYVAFENRKYTLPDVNDYGYLTSSSYKENSVYVGGQIIRSQGKAFHFNADVEAGVVGENAGDLTMKGHGELNFKLLKDTAQLAVNAFITRKNPNFYYRRFHSAFTWWDNQDELDKQTRTRIQGVVDIERTHTKITAGVENISNFLYFQNTATLVNSDEENPIYSNDVSVKQASSVQIISVNLKQDLAFGPLHFDNDITWQLSSDNDVLPLPSITLYSNLYLKFKIAKVLNTEFGADLKFFTKYYAPDYAPTIGQFCNQDYDTREKIGNYPIATIYANFHLKRTRFYIMYYHANQSEGKYFWAPHYPIAPKGLRMGLSWNFYN